MSEVINVPDGWELRTLKDVTLKISDGIHKTPIYADNSDFYFINGNNLNNGKIVITENTNCVDESEYNKHKIELNSSTILLSINGTIGNIAFYHNERVVLGKSAAYLICKDIINKSFLFYLLSSTNIKQSFGLNLTGSTIKNLSIKAIKETKVLFPPLKEQEKIAKILSTLDVAIESTQKLIDKEKNIKKGLMNDLLQNGIDKNGKIRTPQTHKYKDSELGIIPEEWEVKNIEKIADVFGGGTPSRGDEEFWQNGTIFWATPSDITAIKNSNYIYDTKEKITEKALFGSSTKILPIGSILLTSRATIGERKITKIPICTNQGFTSLIPKNDNGKFIFYLLDKYTNYMYSRAYGTTFPEISRTEVKNMLVFLPKDENEQKQITKILNSQDKKIEKEEENLAKLKELKKGLMNDLLSGKVRV